MWRNTPLRMRSTVRLMRMAVRPMQSAVRRTIQYELVHGMAGGSRTGWGAGVGATNEARLLGGTG